jgi:hypothetical protein
MVMGLQRSGTNALFHSLEKDRHFVAFNETHPDLFTEFYLRSPVHVQSVIDASRKPVLLKPISETSRSSLIELLETYRRYEPNLVWIYRDPVNQIHSHRQHHRKQQISVPFEWYVDDYNSRNRKLLDALEAFGATITVVRYESLCESRQLFDAMCSKLQVAGEYLFRADSRSGYAGFDPATIERIQSETRATVDALRASESVLGPVES